MGIQNTLYTLIIKHVRIHGRIHDGRIHDGGIRHDGRIIYGTGVPGTKWSDTMPLSSEYRGGPTVKIPDIMVE